MPAVVPRLVLASASPRRADLLAAAGIACDIVPADVDETPQAGETPDALVRRLAVLKASAVAASHPDRLVLGADTVVVVEDTVLGKPAGPAEAAAMLRRLAGRAHQVLTGVGLAVPGRGVDAAVVAATVEMASLREDEVAWYVASGEGFDKAGGYAIQGLASRFVTAVAGSYPAVVGLPVAEVHRMLRKSGLWHYPEEGMRSKSP
jgi:septum formation protein